MFSYKNPKENVGQFYFNIFFTQFRENEHGSQGSIINPYFFLGKLQCVTNTILMSEYEYKYIWVDFLWRIRIQIYSDPIF